jgi:hypothetical protein
MLLLGIQSGKDKHGGWLDHWSEWLKNENCAMCLECKLGEAARRFRGPHLEKKSNTYGICIQRDEFPKLHELDEAKCF